MAKPLDPKVIAVERQTSIRQAQKQAEKARAALQNRR